MIEWILKALMVLPFVSPPLAICWLVFDHLRHVRERDYWERKREAEFREHMERCRRMEQRR